MCSSVVAVEADTVARAGQGFGASRPAGWRKDDTSEKRNTDGTRRAGFVTPVIRSSIYRIRDRRAITNGRTFNVSGRRDGLSP